jgi:hypothetical protein
LLDSARGVDKMAGMRRLLTWVIAGPLLGAFVAHCDNGWRQDELDCQQAANQLLQCCPGFDASVLYCNYDNTGCQTSYPALTIAESQCIVDESCTTLISTGVCTRAAETMPIQTDDAGLTSHPQVCP